LSTCSSVWVMLRMKGNEQLKVTTTQNVLRQWQSKDFNHCTFSLNNHFHHFFVFYTTT
jgi:hypothetical protein